MMICSPVSTCVKNVVHLKGRLSSSLCSVISCGPSSSCSYRLYFGTKAKYTGISVSSATSGSPAIGCQEFQAGCFRSSRRGGKFQTLTINESVSGQGRQKRQLEISWADQSMKMRLLLPKQGKFQKLKCIGGPISWPAGSLSAGLAFGLLICYSSSEPIHAEASGAKQGKGDEHESSHAQFSHGKKVCTDYSVIGIPGDGRCMFRSVAHGACLRSGKSAPSEQVQRELADDLRAKVADEFIKRRNESEWFVEGDFDSYVSHIRKPHVWGGEPELFMASHVLQMPITVYMYDKDAGGLIAIAEYGQEYGTENPIRVLYHGFGHYDALQMPGTKPGGPSNNLQPLSWAARLRIVQGIARGLMYIHEYSPRKYVHGNLKSTKILLDNELQPYISGFGLTRLVSGTSRYCSSITKRLNSTQIIATSAVESRISSTNSYEAPEAQVSGSKFTQKCDVYSFGIVVLEILTGQVPAAGPENDEKGLEGRVRKAFREERPLSEILDPTLLTEVYAKKQVVAAFHIALNCTELDPELRPRMKTVSESLDRIKLQ